MRLPPSMLLAGVALLASPSLAIAQDAEPEAEMTAREAADRTLTTTGELGPPRTFVIWESEELQGFIKPVVNLASLLVLFMPEREVNQELTNRLSTLALARIGFEGQLFEFLTFRSVFERNLGFSLARNGPVGTSVWEGTASWSARENYLRISRWGLSLTGGIARDEASVDFVSANILDAFGMDPYVRDPLLVSGFNQGQGLFLNYRWRWFTAGLAYTGGNPLVSSLAFSFGGDVSSLGTLFSAPLRALSNGIPGSDIHMNIVSPSLMFDSEYVDVRAAFQYYRVDTDVTSETSSPIGSEETLDDAQLTGWNARASVQVKLWDGRFRIMGAFALRRNDQLELPDVTETKDDFEGLLVGAGLDLALGDFGFGGNYYQIESTLSPDNELTNQYLNIGLTYWLWAPFASVGARYARSMAQTSSETTNVAFDHTDSFILSMRLLI